MLAHDWWTVPLLQPSIVMADKEDWHYWDELMNDQKEFLHPTAVPAAASADDGDRLTATQRAQPAKRVAKRKPPQASPTATTVVTPSKKALRGAAPAVNIHALPCDSLCFCD